MEILYLCQFFAPEPGAPPARILGLSIEWIKSGHTVKVITAFPNHPHGVIPERYRGRLREHERMAGVDVYRSCIYTAPAMGSVKRMLSHLSFAISSVLLSLRRSGHADVVIASSPTLFSLLSGLVFSWVKGAKFVVEVRDLWPAAIEALGVMKGGRLLLLLEYLERWLYRRADHIVVVTRSFRENLMARGIAPEKISVITNGVDTEQYSPGPRDEAVEAELGGRGKTLVLYTGTLGLSQGLDAVLEAAAQLQSDPRVLFAFVGDGADRETLMARAAALGLKNTRFLGLQPRERVVRFYQTADIALVTLKSIPLFTAFIPSKLFEILAVGTPIVAALEGEAAEILRQSSGGTVVKPGDGGALAAAVSNLVNDESERARLGRAGRRFAHDHYRYEVLAKAYEEVLARLVQTHPH